MTNKEAIERLGYIKNQYHTLLNFDDYDEVFDNAIKALEARPQKASDCIPVKDLINYIRNCREELFEKMKDYHPREFEIRDSMLTNFEQLVRLASSKYKADMRGGEE